MDLESSHDGGAQWIEREEMPSCTPTTHLRSVSSPSAMENVSRPEEDEIRAWGTSTSFTLAGETFTVAADDNDEVHAAAALGIWPLPPRSRSGTGKEESVPAG